MSYKIKKEHEAQFNPAWVTVINGKVTKITLKEANENPLRYALTNIAHLYENSEALIKEAKARQKKVVPVKVDMNAVRRGTSFNQKETKKNLILAFKEKQELGLMKIAKRKNLPFQEAKIVDKQVSKKEAAKQKKAKELANK